MGRSTGLHGPWSLCALLLAGPAYSQVGFEALYGGAGSDLGYAVEQTDDGGFIIAGADETAGPNGTDMVLIRTDANGAVVWSANYGQLLPDVAYGLRGTSDGGFVLCGMFSGFGTDTLTLVRTDAQGTVLWEDQYPGGLARDIGYCVQETADGGLVVCGFAGVGTATDAYVVKVDANGQQQWSRQFDLGGQEYANAIVPLPGGGYAVLADNGELGANGDLYLLRLNDLGDTLWTRTLGTGGHDHARGLSLNSDGGFLLAGGASYPDRDILLIRTDAMGAVTWQNTFGDPSRDEMANAVRQLPGGGFAAAGRKEDPITGDVAMHLIQVDGNGNQQWERLYTQGLLAEANGLDLTADGGFVVVGFNVQVVGGSAQTDIYLVRTDGAGYSSTPDGVNGALALDLFPVPASDRLCIAGLSEGRHACILTDLAGDVVWSGELQGPGAVLDVSSFAAGAYMAVVDGRTAVRVTVVH